MNPPIVAQRESPEAATVDKLERCWQREFGGSLWAWDEAWLWGNDNGYATFENCVNLPIPVLAPGQACMAAASVPSQGTRHGCVATLDRAVWQVRRVSAERRHARPLVQASAEQRPPFRRLVGVSRTAPVETETPVMRGFRVIGAPRFELGTSSPPD
jgi:hypothetical protein